MLRLRNPTPSCKRPSTDVPASPSAAFESHHFLSHRLNPQSESQILPLRVTEVRPQLFLIPLSQHFQVQRNRPGEVFYVVPVPLDVALKLGERQVVRVEGE
jgi:hypothetical protein